MRTIHQLTSEELSELNPFNEYTPSQLINKYSDTCFVKEDFFCNIID